MIVPFTGIIQQTITPTSTSSAKIENLLTGRSVATDQQPTAENTSIQVEFGPAQLLASDPVNLLADGSVICNINGTYTFNVTMAAGRTGAASVSWIYARALINGFQGAGSALAKLDNANVVIPLQFSFNLDMSAGQILTVEIYRDSDGNNSGGLIAGIPNLAGWNNASCAAITVSRLIPTEGGSTTDRDQYKLVKSPADLPDPVGTVIEAELNFDYELNGTIDISPNTFKLNGSNKIFGLNPRTDILTTSSVNPLISGTNAGLICEDVTLSKIGAQGDLLAITDTSPNSSSLFIQSCVLTNCSSIGELTALQLVDIEKSALTQAQGGIRFGNGFVEGVRFTGNIIEDTVTGDLVDFGIATFGAASLDHNFLNPSSSVNFLKGQPNSANMPVGSQCSVISNISYGSETADLVGVQYGDDRYYFIANNTIPDSRPTGSLFMSNNGVSTVPLGTGIPVKVAGVTTAGDNIQLFTMTGNNTLRYDGEKILSATATYSITVRRTSGSGTRLVNFYIYKNGSPINGAVQAMEVDNRERSLTVITDDLISKDDSFELWLSNEDNDNEMTVTSLQASIS